METEAQAGLQYIRPHQQWLVVLEEQLVAVQVIVLAAQGVQLGLVRIMVVQQRVVVQ
jgi:hypothetical protein